MIGIRKLLQYLLYTYLELTPCVQACPVYVGLGSRLSRSGDRYDKYPVCLKFQIRIHSNILYIVLEATCTVDWSSLSRVVGVQVRGTCSTP
jgi:hypothetical protein